MYNTKPHVTVMEGLTGQDMRAMFTVPELAEEADAGHERFLRILSILEDM